MFKTVFTTDNDMYTHLAIVSLHGHFIECIYEIPNDKDLEDVDFVDNEDRIKDIDKIISFHDMEKVEHCYPILGMNVYENEVYVLIDNFTGWVNVVYYIKLLKERFPDRYNWDKLLPRYVCQQHATRLKKLIKMYSNYMIRGMSSIILIFEQNNKEEKMLKVYIDAWMVYDIGVELGDRFMSCVFEILGNIEISYSNTNISLYKDDLLITIYSIDTSSIISKLDKCLYFNKDETEDKITYKISKPALMEVYNTCYHIRVEK